MKKNDLIKNCIFILGNWKLDVDHWIFKIGENEYPITNNQYPTDEGGN